MKRYWILITAVVLVVLGIVLHFMNPSGILTENYFVAGDYACGVFAAGTFSIGIFSVGVFSIGVFSLGIFNIGIYAVGVFVFAFRKKCMNSHPKNCEC